MANPLKVVTGVKRLVVGSNKSVKKNKFVGKKLEQAFGTREITTGKAKAAKRAIKTGMNVSTNKSGKLKFSEYNYFGNSISATGGKNSKQFARINKKQNIDTAIDLGVKPGRLPAAKSRDLNPKKIKNTKGSMVPRLRYKNLKSTSKVPTKKRGN